VRQGASQTLRLTSLPGALAVCRLDPHQAIPAWLAGESLLSITRTPHELSIVCGEDLVPDDVRSEKGWRCLAVQGPLPFTLTGVLASLANPLAQAAVSLFAISTFDTDYLLVPAADLERAIATLKAAGHEVVS
jgi:hypothetical protein